MQVPKFRTIKGLIAAYAILIFFGHGHAFSQASVVQQCDLANFDSVGVFHAIYLWPIPGQTDREYVFTPGGGQLTVFSDGTAQVTGRVVNSTNSNLQWDVDFWLVNQLDYASWNGLGRDVKIELAPQAVVAANQQDWLFWEMDSTRSRLTGVPGTFYAGDTLFTSHDPPNRQFGFQYGLGANSKNASFGLSGWFRFTGSYTAHGDINVNAHCGNSCDLQVTEARPLCTSDSTFKVRLGIQGSGNAYEIQDAMGNTLLSNLSAGTYLVGPFAQGSAADLTIRDANNTACDTSISLLSIDCTPIQVCDLRDFDTTGAFHAVYLFAYPGQTDPRYIFDANGGKLTTFGDGTALITGRVINAANPNLQWDIQYWLEQQRDFATWNALGRGVKIEQAPPAVVAANQQDWIFWEVDSLRSIMTGVPGSSLAGDTLFVSHDPPNRQFGFQFGQGANSKNGGFGLSGWFRFTGSYTNHGDINVLAECGSGNNCDLQVTEARPLCTSDSTFEVRVGIQGSGNDYQILDGMGNALLSNLSAGTYLVGPFAQGSAADLTIRDANNTACDTSISLLSIDCTPIQVCDLRDFDTTGAFHAVYLFAYPGQTDPRYIFDANGGKLTTFGDGTALITGRVINAANPNLQWDIQYWLEQQRDFATWNALGRGVKIEQAPPAVVAANQQDWIFWEVDSLRSIMTGVPGSSLAGDTLFVSHDPPNRQFGFQFGQGANSKNGGFGLSGWFRFTGSYTNHGDINVLAECGSGRLCDLEVSRSRTHCLTDSTFEVEITFTGTGNGYQILDGLGNVLLSGIGAGSYSFGPYASGSSVDFQLLDTTIPGCDTTLTGLTQDCTPPCDLQLLSAIPNCISNSQFEVVVNFSGTGNGFVLNDDQGSPVQSGSAGTYTFGPYANNTVVSISITDTNGVNCDTTVVGLTQDCTPPCDLQLLSAIPNCISNSQFEVVVNFSGTGNGFVLNDDQGSPVQSGSAGTYTFGPYANNTVVSISITDTNGVNCDTTVVGLTQDCTPPCDLQLLSAIPNCISNSQFEVVVNFSGTGNGFVLNDDQGSVPQSGSAGTYTFGPYANNTVVSISITDTNGVNCDTTVVGLTQDCTPPCDLQLLSAIPNCISNSQFEVVVNFSGTGNGFVLNDDQGSPVQSGSAGTYTFGPYANNTVVSLSITDTNGVNCDTTVVGLTQDCTPPCDLQLLSAIPNCISNSQFEVVVNFSGTGNGFVLNDDQGSVPQSGSAGTYTFGPYANNTVVSISITDTNGVNCDTTVVGLTQDCTPPCDLQLLSAIPNCISNSQFEVVVNFSGTGNGFVLNDDQGSVPQSGSAGTYTFGPYANNTVVSISITDTNGVNCDTTVVGLTQDCTPPCDLQLLSAIPNCISNSQFEVVVNFSGTGNGFVLNDDQGSVPQSGSAGTYTFGPYANNTVVSISITDTNGVNCDTTVVGLTQDCTPPCDLQLLSAIPNCISNSQFEVVVNFSGTGNGFVLNDDQGSPVQSGSAGTYTFGPYANNTVVSLSITDTNGVNCDTTVVGLTQDCTPPCDLQLLSAIPNCISNSQFEVVVNFSGTGNGFVLNDDQGSPVQSGSAGTYTFGPYANNTVVSISITDTNGVNCDTTVVGLTQDCTPPCDLQLLSAIPNCISNSQFEVVVNFSGTGNGFVLNDDQGSVSQSGSAGTYTFGPYANNTVVSISITDTNGVNCDTTVVGLTQDCTPPCDLQLLSAIPNCISNSQFEVVVNFSGTGNGFVLNDDQGSVSQSGSAGTYTFGPYANNTVVSISITDTNGVNCDTTVVGLTQDCTPPCVIQAGNPVISCLPSGEFEVEVSFSGNGSGYSLTDDQGISSFVGSAGTYVFGPYASNTLVSISITDTSKANCSIDLNNLSSSCPQPCNLQVLSAIPTCIGNSNQFEITIDFTGSGSNYQLTDNQGNPAQTGAPGQYTFGPYSSGVLVDIGIVDLDTTTVGCDTLLSGISTTCTPICDFSIDTIFASCFSPDSFVIKLVLQGVGDGYQVTDNVGNVLTGVSPSPTDTVIFGTYFNSTDVFVTVADTNIAGCDTLIGPITADCTPVNPCVLTLDSVSTVCAGSDSFCVMVSFSGPPSDYRISDNLFQNFIQTDSAGTYMIGCYPNNTPVVIEVRDLNLFACIAMSGVLSRDCSNPPANNECVDAQTISCNTIVNGTTNKASAGNFGSTCNNVNVSGHPGVWYKIVGNGNLISINTCATFPFRNTAINVFKGVCGNLRCVTANDDTPSCPGGPSEVAFLSDPNVEYFVFVSTPPGAEGNFTLRISCNNSKKLVPNLIATDAKTNIRLNWSVEQEVDVEGYNIERSLDGINFEWIDFQIAEEGYSLTGRDYQYEDYSAEFNKTYYYRLEQIRKGGSKVYSQIAYASIYTDKDMFLGNLYPNPTRTAFKVDLYAHEEGDITLYLMDDAGRILQSFNKDVHQGNNILEVDVSWLISGVYYVKFTYKGQRESRKLVLIR